VTLSVSPTSVARGGSITATWAGIPSPTSTDWLGLYTPGSPDNNTYQAWHFTTGSASGSIAFPIPATLPAGTYELRLYAHNTYTRLATSNPIVVPENWTGR